jgi:SAM-dependent methyltransferase
MFIEESVWIKKQIESLNVESNSLFCDMGAADYYYRNRIQPHIYNNIYKPLIEKKVTTVSCDVFDSYGIDYKLDITNPSTTPYDILEKKFDLILSANMLEHVTDRDIASKNILSIAKPGSFLIVTVPQNYFLHDVDDTMYRPKPEEITALFKQFAKIEVMAEEIIDIKDKSYYTMPVYPNKLLHNIPFFAFRKRWRLLFKSTRWKQSCVLIKVIEINKD